MKKVLFFVLFNTILIGISAQEVINQLDANGKFHGKYKKLYSNGNLRYEGTFDHGKEVGIFKFYAVSGEKTPIAIKEYFPKNDTIKISYFTLSGKLESEGKMIEKERIGEWKYYFPDGKTLMSIEHYNHDKLDGEVKIFYKDGTLTEISHYKNGNLHGNRKRFAEDGKPVEDLNYFEGKVHGPAVIYDEKGEIYAKGNYENGLKTGEWEFKINGQWVKTESPEKVIDKK